jgi:hypothetical protein
VTSAFSMHCLAQPPGAVRIGPPSADAAPVSAADRASTSVATALEMLRLLNIAPPFACRPERDGLGGEPPSGRFLTAGSEIPLGNDTAGEGRHLLRRERSLAELLVQLERPEQVHDVVHPLV